jgi:competence protein ComEC
MAQWPGAVATFAQPPLGLGLLGMLGCAWLLVRWPGGVRWLGLSLVLPLLLWQPPRPKPGEFSLLALDIGQGSSLLLQTAQHALLVDTGPRWASGDAGSQSIVPLLQALGVRLNRVLLTHADSDHTGGALSVLAAQPQADLLGSGIAALADQAQRPWQPCARGQQWAWDGVHFSVLWPAPATVKAANHKNTNAQSCVLLVRSAHGATALLAGDLERAQEHALLALHAGQSSDLQAHALVVAHHGSQTSTSAPWLAAVQPQVALIQSGWRNRFGHPAAAVVQRLTAAQARIFNTAQCGAIDWQSSRPDQAQCQRQRQPRYWQTLPHPTPTALATNTTGPE